MGLALADLDADGAPEIIAINTNVGGLSVFRNDGTLQFQTAGGAPIAVSVADIDTDGVPEILLGNSVFDNRGQLKLTLAGCGKHDSAYASKLDPALPGLQILCGDQVYDGLGKRLFSLLVNSRYRFAVADFLGKRKPQFALVADGALFLVDHQGARLWSTYLGGGNGGTPTAADLDGYGISEIGVAGSGYYTALRGDGSILWQSLIRDYSSSSTGSTAFDFDGDGKVEIVYRDEVRLFVFDGATGNVTFSSASGSLTGAEYPLVADADGHADIVVPEDAGDFNGIRVFEDLNNPWVPTRCVWNQFDYSINNINDDLSVPRNPEPSWKGHNTFRLNRRTDADPHAIADLSASYVRVQDMGAEPLSRIIVRLGNAGSYKVPAGTPVAVYDTDPGLGQPAATALVAQGQSQKLLESGAYEDLALSVPLPLGRLGARGNVWIVADDDGSGGHTLSDFDRSNNLVQADLSAIASNLQIAVGSDKAVYAETESARFTATVRNGGSFERDALVRLSVEDATGQSVDILPLGAAIRIAPGANAQVQAPWSAAAVLAGGYQVRAELITPQGLVYGSSTAPFAVHAGRQQRQPEQHPHQHRPSRYSAAQVVLIESRMANLSSNQLQDKLQAATEVIAPDAQSVLSRTEQIAQIGPRSQRWYQYSLPAARLQAGSYQARLQLMSAAGVVLSASSTRFTIEDSRQTAIGIIGQLSANPATVALTSVTRLQLALRNSGNAAISGATVRVRVLDPDGVAELSTFTQPGVQLAIGASASYAWDWTAQGRAGATLPVTASIEFGGSGAETALAQTTVQLKAGAAGQQALTGTLRATPKSVPAGTAVQLHYSAHNPNTHSVAASFTLSVRALGSSAVLQQWELPQTLTAGANFLGNQGWSPGAAATDTRYEATWSATVADQTTVLATDSFGSAAPAESVQAQIGDGSDARPLILLSCSAADDGQPQSPACDEAKAQALRAYLRGQDLMATVVTSRAEFETGMRCGKYNIYWISGGSDKLGGRGQGVARSRRARRRPAPRLRTGCARRHPARRVGHRRARQQRTDPSRRQPRRLDLCGRRPAHPGNARARWPAMMLDFGLE